MRRFLLEELPEEAWKNGGGTTRVVFEQQREDGATGFDCRVSIATVSKSGPFSIFPGIDRIATVLENGPLNLARNVPPGQPVLPLIVCERYVPAAFDGEADLYGHVTDNPVLCLNVMTRRATCCATVHAVYVSTYISALPRSNMVIIATGSGWEVNSAPLDRFQGMFIDLDVDVSLRTIHKIGDPLIVVSLQREL